VGCVRPSIGGQPTLLAPCPTPSPAGYLPAHTPFQFVRADKADDKPAKETGFTTLFDGKNLDGWHIMNKGKFSAKDGVIFLDRGNGWLRSDKEYKDFELRLDFRFIDKGADSGVFIRAGKDGANWPAKNYQVQTKDDNSIADIFPAGYSALKNKKKNADKLKKARKATGEWQSFVIIAKGEHMEVTLNGELITTSDGAVDKAGYIGLQGEGGRLEFKNIRIKELK
jgi:hypothetical protein